MAKEQYEHVPLRESSLYQIRQANVIIAEYQAKGFKITLRQLYYQHVQRGMIENTIQSYKRLGELISKGRIAGLIDWDAIEDRTRNLEVRSTWDNTRDMMKSARDWYQQDPWLDQQVYCEVWVEKEALSGIIQRICNKWFAPWLACRGYVSQTEIKDAGDRFAWQSSMGKHCVVLHLGDHDPSGLDMTRDNTERLAMFAREEIEIRRLALNYEQIEELGLPPNPAKETDARFAAYADEHGDESWELDALQPEHMAQLIGDEIQSLIDQDAWDEARARSNANKQVLAAVEAKWPEVLEWLNLTETTKPE